MTAAFYNNINMYDLIINDRRPCVKLRAFQVMTIAHDQFSSMRADRPCGVLLCPCV